MAKVKGMAATNYVGKLGPAVFYMRHGVNINRALAAESANPQTAEQMTQRNRLTNVVRAYQANKAWMELFAYENVPEGRTLYNEFVAQNLPFSFVYLTKAEVAAYTSIVGSYKFTRGSLPRISYKFISPLELQTNIVLGENAEGIVTIADLSSRILANNTNWQEGDQLSIVVNVYRADALPEVMAYEFTLDTTDQRDISTMGISSVMTYMHKDSQFFIGVSVTDFDPTTPVGILACKSRKQGGKVLVSTQAMLLNEPAEAMWTEYSGLVAQQRARRSYGGIGEPFLNPGDQNAEGTLADPVAFSKSFPITYANVDGTTITMHNGLFGGDAQNWLKEHLTFNGGGINIAFETSSEEGDMYIVKDAGGSDKFWYITSLGQPKGTFVLRALSSSGPDLDSCEVDGEQIEP